MALEYPKMLYHDFYGQRIVETQDEEMELMGKNEGWRDTPIAQQQVAPRSQAAEQAAPQPGHDRRR